jgi:hypothetical protein
VSAVPFGFSDRREAHRVRSVALLVDLGAFRARIRPNKIRVKSAYEGSIVALADPAAWRLDIQFQDKGYVTDTDAADLNAKELFDSYVQGTNAMNETRRKNGIDELFIDNARCMGTQIRRRTSQCIPDRRSFTCRR